MDIFFLNKYFNFAKLLGIVPISTERRILSSTLPVLYNIGYIFLIVWAGTERIKIQLKSSKIQGTIDVCQVLLDTLFVLSSISSSLYGFKNWKIMIKTINSLDRNLVNGGSAFDKGRITYILQLLVAFMLWFSLTVGSHVLLQPSKVNLVFLPYHVSNFYTIFIILLIYHLSATLKRRISFYNYNLKSILCSNTDARLCKIDIIRIKKLYLNFGIVTQHFNIVFGWLLFFYISNSLITVLDLINFTILLPVHDYFKNDANIYCGILSLFYLVIFILSYK